MIESVEEKAKDGEENKVTNDEKAKTKQIKSPKSKQKTRGNKITILLEKQIKKHK